MELKIWLKKRGELVIGKEYKIFYHNTHLNYLIGKLREDRGYLNHRYKFFIGKLMDITEEEMVFEYNTKFRYHKIETIIMVKNKKLKDEEDAL